MAIYVFIKDQLGWYIDLKNSPFNRNQLAMVRGADTFLDIMAEGEKKITIEVSTSFIKGYQKIYRKKILRFGFKGANYIAEKYKGRKYNHSVFLCPVTLWVFLRYPKIIYFKVL